MAVNQATISLHDMCSKTTLESLERSSSSAEFAVNAEALPGSSLKRKLSVVDTSAKKKAAKPQVSRFAHALPSFVGVKFSHRKPHSELESIRQKNAQMGMQPAAGAAGTAASQDGRLPFLQTDSGESAEADPSICMVLLSDSRTEVEHRHLPPLLQPPHSTNEAGGRSTQEVGTDTSAAGGKKRPRRKARLPKGLVDFDTAGWFMGPLPAALNK